MFLRLLERLGILAAFTRRPWPFPSVTLIVEAGVQRGVLQLLVTRELAQPPAAPCLGLRDLRLRFSRAPRPRCLSRLHAAPQLVDLAIPFRGHFIAAAKAASLSWSSSLHVQRASGLLGAYSSFLRERILLGCPVDAQSSGPSPRAGFCAAAVSSTSALLRFAAVSEPRRATSAHAGVARLLQ